MSETLPTQPLYRRWRRAVVAYRAFHSRRPFAPHPNVVVDTDTSEGKLPSVGSVSGLVETARTVIVTQTFLKSARKRFASYRKRSMDSSLAQVNTHL